MIETGRTAGQERHQAVARSDLALVLLQLAASRANIDDFALSKRANPQRAARSYHAAAALASRG